MSETTTFLIENAEAKESKNGKPYWKAKGLQSWNVDLTQYEGQQVEIEYEPAEFNGYQYKKVTKLAVKQDAPSLGTGQYVRAKTAKDDQIAVNARKALEEAVKSFQPLPVNAELKTVNEHIAKVSLVQSKLYLILSGFSLPKTDDDNIPF